MANFNTDQISELRIIERARLRKGGEGLHTELHHFIKLLAQGKSIAGISSSLQRVMSTLGLNEVGDEHCGDSSASDFQSISHLLCPEHKITKEGLAMLIAEHESGYEHVLGLYGSAFKAYRDIELNIQSLEDSLVRLQGSAQPLRDYYEEQTKADSPEEGQKKYEELHCSQAFRMEMEELGNLDQSIHGTENELRMHRSTARPVARLACQETHARMKSLSDDLEHLRLHHAIAT